MKGAAPPTGKVTAPWSDEEIDALNHYQRSGLFHEFACVETHKGLDRTLVATRAGWICLHCGYTQDWAHRFMLDKPKPHRVRVTGGDYVYEGLLVGTITKTTGEVRFIVEDSNRRLFIHNRQQCAVLA